MALLLRLSITARVSVLVGVLLGMLALIAGVAFEGDRRSSELAARADRYNHLAATGLAVRVEVLQARRHEKDFQLRSDPAYIPRFRDAIAGAGAHLQRLEAEPLLSADAQRARSGLRALEQAFIRYADTRMAQGLDENAGLSGALRSAVHAVEQRLRQLVDGGADPRRVEPMQIAMLTLRRHEKDFMMRLSERDVVAHARTVTQLDRLIAASDFAPETVTALRRDLALYAERFQAWVKGATDLAELGRNLSAASRALEPVLDAVVEASRRQATESQATLATLRQQQAFVGMAAIGLAFALAVVVAWLVGRSISRPVREMAQAIGALSEGTLDRAVTPAKGRNEIADMVVAYAKLQASLQAARRLEAERAERHAADVARAAAVSRVAGSVQRVVTAARDGQLDVRADLVEGAEELQDMVLGLNEVCASTQRFLDDLQSTAGALASGDLSRTMPDGFKGQFGQVAVDLNTAIVRLAHSILKAQQASAETANASIEIRTVADDFAKRTETQAATIEEVGAAVEEFATSVRATSESARALDRAAKSAARQAEEATAVSASALEAMTRIEATSQRVIEIAELINTIAFQTNLLALNASVEAARAGEQGRGFAVVADEVRRLAAQAAEAAQSVRRVVTDTEAEIALGSDCVREAAQALRHIATAVAGVTDVVEQIAKASAEQAATVTEIGHALQDLDVNTQRNAAAAEENASAADALQRNAEDLASTMTAFRTGGGGVSTRRPLAA